MAFEDIIGHEKPKNLLRGILANRNIPHSFLFCGQDGIGKRRAAQEFVKYLFCETSSACGLCRSCIKLERNSHPDLIVVQTEGSIGIDQSRMLRKEVSEHPFEAERRVIIIDNADSMTHEAANALLKTLEEPPPFNHFILVTSSEKNLPLTIRSRCMRVFFAPLTRTQLEQYFRQTLFMAQEKAGLLAQISFGSIGSGLFWARDENLLLRRQIAGFVIGKDRSFVSASAVAEKISKIENGFNMYLAFLLSLFRDVAVSKRSLYREGIINSDLLETGSWEGLDGVWIERSMKRIQETSSVMRYNINRLLAFENLLFQLMR